MHHKSEHISVTSVGRSRQCSTNFCHVRVQASSLCRYFIQFKCQQTLRCPCRWSSSTIQLSLSAEKSEGILWNRCQQQFVCIINVIDIIIAIDKKGNRLCRYKGVDTRTSKRTNATYDGDENRIVVEGKILWILYFSHFRHNKLSISNR